MGTGDKSQRDKSSPYEVGAELVPRPYVGEPLVGAGNIVELLIATAGTASIACR